MSHVSKLLSMALLCVLSLGSARTFAQEAVKVRPNVEVVFVVDTTGSMTGLIDAAKQKVWAISNQIAAGKPTPRLKIGLVAFRDRGDEYITQVTDLSEDLDMIHGKVMAWKADGGGDTPESVNEALFDAVHKIKWSTDKKTLKIIFLVGDAPPHMDYKEVQYPETCKVAVAKDIIINTIQCGNDPECRKYWEHICALGEGRYVQIDAAGGPVITVVTPFDADLAKINEELCRSTLCWGGKDKKEKEMKSVDDARKLSAPAAADRAGYSALTDSSAAFDLLDNLKDGKVTLESIKKDELPDVMQKMTLAEQKEHLEKLAKLRTELNARAVELSKKRTEFITKKLSEDKKSRVADTFDNQVLRILAEQARRNGIEYSIDEKKK